MPTLVTFSGGYSYLMQYFLEVCRLQEIVCVPVMALRSKVKVNMIKFWWFGW